MTFYCVYNYVRVTLLKSANFSIVQISLPLENILYLIILLTSIIPYYFMSPGLPKADVNSHQGRRRFEWQGEATQRAQNQGK